MKIYTFILTLSMTAMSLSGCHQGDHTTPETQTQQKSPQPMQQDDDDMVILPMQLGSTTLFLPF